MSVLGDKQVDFDVFSTVHRSIELFHLPTLMHNSLFINNMYATLLSSTCFEHSRATIPDAVCIQLVLLKMGMLMLETCRG